MNPFYIVAHESGAENDAIATWANRDRNPAALVEGDNLINVQRVELEAIPGAFQLLNVLSKTECEQLIEITERLGFNEDAAVSLPRRIRHNHSATWVVDELTDGLIWSRMEKHCNRDAGLYDGREAVGLNARFRFYRYGVGDYFKPHRDGDWPGSRVINGELVTCAYPDRWSEMTVLLFLTDDFQGGATQFFRPDQQAPSTVNRHLDSQNDPTPINVRTLAGGALCFPHGSHPLHCVHGSEAITAGVKYIIRTDMLFKFR